MFRKTNKLFYNQSFINAKCRPNVRKPSFQNRIKVVKGFAILVSNVANMMQAELLTLKLRFL